MFSIRISIRRLFLLTLAAALPAASAPIATPDNYSTPEDTPLTIAAPGLLVNDLPNGMAGLMRAAKVTDPARGTLAVQPDGSFSYTPEADYSGPDSFQYKVVEAQAPILLTVDQPNSTLTVNVQSNVIATGVSDNETTTVHAKGNMTALITPGLAPFSTAQIRTMNVALAEQASLTLCVVELFGGCIGTLTARIDPDGLLITMSEGQAGPPAPVNAGVFNQPGNRIDTSGTIFLSTGGVASGIAVPPSAALNSTDMAYDFTNAGITQSGGTLTLSAPIDISQVITDPQFTATVRITGTIRATAPVPSAGAESPATTVTLNVTSVDDPPVAVTDRYYTRQNYAIAIPATASQPFTETLIPGNSVWRYSTGADLGTGWRAIDFVDTAWPTGTGVLGYDTDNLIATTIPARANMAAAASAANPNYPTAYFRREFTLATPFDTVQPRVEFQRDDACIIYVNGVEIYRDSTPYTGDPDPPLAASGDVAYATYTAATIPEPDSLAYKSVAFSRGLLREGRNVIAAEVHQAGATSSDLRFDLKCYRTTGVGGLGSNDTDIDGPAMHLVVQSPPPNGSVTLNPDGSFTYLPHPGFPGTGPSATDSFIYRHSSGAGSPTSSALVEIIVLNDDLDGDDVSDTWERSFGLDASVTDGSADADSDGQSNRAEFLAGTDPLNASSSFQASFLTQPNPGQLQIALDSVPGQTYQLQNSDSLSAWLDTGPGFPAHATDSQTVIQFDKPADQTKFYRVRVVNDWQ